MVSVALPTTHFGHSPPQNGAGLVIQKRLVAAAALTILEGSQELVSMVDD